MTAATARRPTHTGGRTAGKTGVEDPKQIFSALRRILRAYQPLLKPRKVSAAYFDLWSEKDVDIDGRRHKGVFFAAVAVQKDYVGFYYMPVYTHAEAERFLPEDLMRLLKGKSCFHIRSLTPRLERGIATALKKGFTLYRRRGWIDG